jgi:hypothetical protein
VHAHASLAWNNGNNPYNMTADQIVDEMHAHFLPGTLLIPAAVGELVRLQDKGYRLVVNH